MADRQQANQINVRKIALDVLMDIMEEGVFCHQALGDALAKYPLEKRDRSFLTRLVEGTVERCLELDYIINGFSKVRTDKMKPVIRNILRMAVYQIYYMNQVPDSAACNEAVKLTVKRRMHNLKGFVNGVLRNIVRNKDLVSYPDESDEVRYLSVRYSMPEWIVKRFLREYGSLVTGRILESFLREEKETSIRCTVSRYTAQEVRVSLENQGTLVTSGKFFPYGFHISGYSAIQNLEAFQKGMFQVQDDSSMVVGAVAGVRKGDVVLDVCAAPGGKTLHCADILAGTGKVVSADLTVEKTKRIKENVQRLGYENITVLENDARVYRREWKEMADVVIADLPCSGLGVIGKKCDIKYKTIEVDIEALASVQREILTTVVKYLKKGGTLVYSTCTIAKEENQENVKWMEENLPLQLCSMEERLPEALQGLTGKDGYIQILPHMADTDGFFLALFKRT